MRKNIATTRFSPRLRGLIYFILLIPHLKPGSFSYLGQIDMIFDVLRVFSGIIIIPLYIISEVRINRIILLIGVFFAIQIISTLTNGLEIRVIGITFVSVFCSLLLTDLMITKDTKIGLNVMAVAFEILAYANLLSILLWPEGTFSSPVVQIGGSRRGYLLTHQGGMIYYSITGFIILMIMSSLDDSGLLTKIRTLSYFIAIVLSNILAWSATPIVVFFAIVILLLITRKRNYKIISVSMGIIGMIAAFILFVVYRLQDAFSWLLVDILRRDITFSTRTYLWDQVSQLISQKTALGWGNIEGAKMAQMFGSVYYIHAHNQILQVLFVSGIVGLVAFFIVWVFFAKSVDGGKRDRFSRAITVVVLPLLIFACLAEPPFTTFFSLNCIFILGTRLDEIRRLVSNPLSLIE